MGILVRLFVVVAVFLAVPSASASADGLIRANKGSLTCIIGHIFRNPSNKLGKELSFTGLRFRNYNDKGQLIIGKLTIYAGDGTEMTGPFEKCAQAKGCLSQTFLKPHQTARIDSIDLFGKGDPRFDERWKKSPAQAIVTWKSDTQGTLELWGNVARTDRTRLVPEEPTSSLGRRLTRGLLRCARKEPMP